MQFLQGSIAIDKGGTPTLKGKVLRAGQSVEANIGGKWVNGHMQYLVDLGWVIIAHVQAQGLTARLEDDGKGDQVKIIV